MCLHIGMLLGPLHSRMLESLTPPGLLYFIDDVREGVSKRCDVQLWYLLISVSNMLVPQINMFVL
jgi:hypothetical protein